MGVGRFSRHPIYRDKRGCVPSITHVVSQEPRLESLTRTSALVSSQPPYCLPFCYPALHISLRRKTTNRSDLPIPSSKPSSNEVLVLTPAAVEGGFSTSCTCQRPASPEILTQRVLCSLVVSPAFCSGDSDHTLQSLIRAVLGSLPLALNCVLFPLLHSRK